MGTGKTSVGKVLSKRLNRLVIDVDRYIEEGQKRKIREIFERDGEVSFRQLEKKAIEEITQKDNLVITTGGGAVLDPENLERLKSSGWVICLSAAFDTIYKRVKGSRNRPLLNHRDVAGEVERLLILRKPYYEKADMEFKTDKLTSAQVAENILEALKGKI